MENYEKLCFLGHGTYGCVTKCRDVRTHKTVAIKKHFNKGKMQLQLAVKREYAILRKVRHDNIVTLIEVFKHKGFLYGVYEFLKQSVHDELKTKRGGLEKDTLRRYSLQLLRAVEFLHQNNIMHRDIKPDNLLISHSGVLKLGDFGNARYLAHSGRPLTPLVCAVWCSGPEILLKDSYGTPADMWAIGCSIFCMATRRYLLNGTSVRHQLEVIVQKIGPLSEKLEQLYFSKYGCSAVLPINTRRPVSLSEKYCLEDADLAKLVDLCFQVDPADRPSCSQLLQQCYFTRDNLPDTFLQELQEMIQEDLAYDESEDSLDSWDKCLLKMEESIITSTFDLDEGQQEEEEFSDISLFSWEESQRKEEEVCKTSLQGEPEQQMVGDVSATSQQVEGELYTRKCTRGIKGAFCRAFKAMKGFFTRCIIPKDKHEEPVPCRVDEAEKSGTSQLDVSE